MITSRLLLLLSFSTRKHTSVASRVILSNFFEEQWIQNHPQYLSGFSRALFPTAFLEIAVYLYIYSGADAAIANLCLQPFSFKYMAEFSYLV